MSDYDLLTLDIKNRIIATAMFSEREQRNIELKAIEQALREAGLARVDLEPLLPVGSTWPFLLTEPDRDFLRINKISAA